MKLFNLLRACAITAIFFPFVVGTMYAHPEEVGIDFESTEPLFISLGSHCRPALNMRKQGLRQAAFPFDWYLSVDGKGVIKCLDEDFAHFLDLATLRPFANTGDLLNHYYRFEFSHEGSFSGLNFYKKINGFIEKYQRRIHRFRKLNDYKGRVYFIRTAWPLSTHSNYAFHSMSNLSISETDAKELFASLTRYFQDLDFYLIIINPESENDSKLKVVERILFFETDQEEYDLMQFVHYINEGIDYKWH